MRQQRNSAEKQKQQKHPERTNTKWKRVGRARARWRRMEKKGALTVEHLTLQKLTTIYSLNNRIQFKVSDKMRFHIAGKNEWIWAWAECQILCVIFVFWARPFVSFFAFKIAHFSSFVRFVYDIFRLCACAFYFVGSGSGKVRERACD